VSLATTSCYQSRKSKKIEKKVWKKLIVEILYRQSFHNTLAIAVVKKSKDNFELEHFEKSKKPMFTSLASDETSYITQRQQIVGLE
jgi:hypothetical protein